MKQPEPLTVTTGGDDYVAMWKGNKQIMCYHGDADSVLDAVCEAYGIEQRTLDISGMDTNEEWWEPVDGASLEEAKEIRDRILQARADAEIEKHEQAIREIKARRP